ncbi:unnamed protein product [Rotaria magnacalcarata]|uniref:Prolyl 4-hydroxylase alpha subunit domain-containing protein n=1 Tax=Rotaria magnacalcarata TaxID=392030 RepID=A0A8S2JMZ9_9BILA|nr:unnamed protein product [Rotaria magnacalcarata]CAF3815196.1 unnamed protein product [Rotaria magnacalcarata]CAF3991237.1 unnamed protein product [Rotaria magnacalcarata]
MLDTEVELTKQLKTYLEEENKRMDHIKKFLNLIESQVSRAKGNEEKYSSNPINSFLLSKHLTIEWNHIKTMVSPDLSKIIDKQWLFPSLEDYIGHECYAIGRAALVTKDFYHALMWLQEALDRIDQENNTTLISKINILNNLVNATFQQGNIEHALVLAEEILSIDPGHVEAKKNKIHYESLINKHTLMAEEQEKVDFKTTDDTDSIGNSLKQSSIQYVSMNNKNFQVKNQRPGTNLELKSRQALEEICRQQHAQLSKKRQATLFCRYRHNNHPYLILIPVKEEKVLDEPAVFLFHDVVSDSDIEKIKALAVPRLQRALVRNPGTNTMTPTNYRISKRSPTMVSVATTVLMWIFTMYAFIFQAFAKSIIVNVMHLEIGKFCLLPQGNKIATWMTYMSDVEWGGATFFPLFGGYVTPKKGSTLFWYNLHASGEADYRTLHAACPVLIGNKWIANKWIHEYGQEFRRRCSLDPMA